MGFEAAQMNFSSYLSSLFKQFGSLEPQDLHGMRGEEPMQVPKGQGHLTDLCCKAGKLR